jgi:hypothetical protein
LERDRVAAYMVRAAATGAVDYSVADPTDINWRIRHRLLLREVHRKEEQDLLKAVHSHWCAYVSHGNLNDDSFSRVKKELSNAIVDLKNNAFPWDKSDKKDNENSTIDSTTQQLIDIYKAMPEISEDEEDD